MPIAMESFDRLFRSSVVQSGQQTFGTLRELNRCAENIGPHTQGVLLGIEDLNVGIGFGKGRSVIFHLEDQVAAFPEQADVNVPCRRMFEGIVNQFLDDPKQVYRIPVGKRVFGAGLTDVNGSAAGALHVLTERVDTGFEVVMVHAHRHEPSGDASDGVDDGQEVGVHAGDERLGFYGVSFGAVEAVQVKAEDRQALDQVVVDFGAHFIDDLFGGLHRLAGDFFIEGGLGLVDRNHKPVGLCKD